jgi:hypothetical protein
MQEGPQIFVPAQNDMAATAAVAAIRTCQRIVFGA